MSENSKNRQEEPEQTGAKSVSEERSNPSIEDRYSWDDLDDLLDGIETTAPDKGKSGPSLDDSPGFGHEPKTQDVPEIGKTGTAAPVSPFPERARSEAVPEAQGLPQVASEDASPKSYTGPYSRLRIPPEKPKRASFESEENKPHRTENTSYGDPLDDTPFQRIDSERLDESDIGQTKNNQGRSGPPIDPSRLSSSRVEQELPSIRPVREDGNLKHRRADTEKLAIVGGKMTGKSYLFHAIMHRLSGGGKAGGAMGYFLDTGKSLLQKSAYYDEAGETITVGEFLKPYQQWYRLEFTEKEAWTWFKMHIPLRSGLWGKGKKRFEIAYWEAAGEGFFEQAMHGDNREHWNQFLDTKTIVFCLPLWAAFPGKKMTTEDWESRDKLLTGLDRVSNHFINLFRENEREPKARTILALTMADDRRGGLSALRENWIEAYMQGNERNLLDLMASNRGLIRYLANARRVSNIIHTEMERSPDIRIQGIPSEIKFGSSETWFIPMTAIHGDTLDRMEQGKQKTRAGIRAPVPVHVELPLLVAISDGRQALM